MENKYYTPEIEEFYIGFEYELLETYGEEKLWAQLDIDHSDNFPIHLIEDQLNDELIRVKYLDSEDIESLGFEKSYTPSYITDEMIELYSIGNEEDWYNLEFQDNNVIITKCHMYNEVTGNWNQDCIFTGVIKNKSELKKLLTQLEVC
jgi:hypothetical protein